MQILTVATPSSSRSQRRCSGFVVVILTSHYLSAGNGDRLPIDRFLATDPQNGFRDLFGFDQPPLRVCFYQLGQCLVNMREFQEARTAFQGAARDDRSERDALRWLQFVETEIARDRANREALASLQ